MTKTKQRLASLPALKINVGERFVHPAVTVRDGQTFVSAEEGDGLADYYGEFTGGHPFIHPALETWATEHDSFWDWADAGTLILSE